MNLLYAVLSLMLLMPGLCIAMNNNEQKTVAAQNQSSSSNTAINKIFESDQSCPCCSSGMRQYSQKFLLSLKPIKESNSPKSNELTAKINAIIPPSPAAGQDPK